MKLLKTTAQQIKQFITDQLIIYYTYIIIILNAYRAGFKERTPVVPHFGGGKIISDKINKKLNFVCKENINLKKYALNK